jgi:hypothetical protein
MRKLNKAKYLLAGFACTLALGILSAPTTLAGTPDGLTPPNEGVCDPLQADGISKGLYGLCVAFCEAQDWADEAIPITELGYLALEQGKPSGRILANYNKKKGASDPDMPCILVQEPCPCWTAEEIASIDGVIDGVTGEASCTTYPIPFSGTALGEELAGDPAFTNHFAASDTIGAGPGNRGPRCAYTDKYSSPAAQRSILVTPEQFQVCQAMVEEQAQAIGEVCD